MVIDTDAGPIGWYDFERDNVRTKSSFGENVFFEVAARFASHGEVVRSVLSSLGHDDGLTEDYVFLLDEPDQALDFAGVRDLIVVLWEMKPGQIIVAAHHPLVLFERKFNVVEMAPGFLAGVRKSLTAALGDGGVDV
jgi:predicted ATPase